ncbi:MAG: metallophosphoesterase [Burkholderiales bacterium]|nr:metallophosphoesterase [Anaerolineae bacterium]
MADKGTSLRLCISVSLRYIAFLIITACSVAEAQTQQPFTLTILHTNDEHSHHLPNADDIGGAARLATVVQQIRAETDNLLLLDAGDRFTGTDFHDQHRGQDSAQIMNLLGYDAMTLGNHEFDDGDEVLAAFIDALEFPVVSANVDFSTSDALRGKVELYVVLTVGGESIGIIGLTTRDTQFEGKAGEGITFSREYAAIVQPIIDQLAADGVNKIVLLTHLGILEETPLANAVSGVDIIVGGHSHTLLSNTDATAEGPYPTVFESASGEPVLWVQAGVNGTHVGRIDLTFDANGILTTWQGDTLALTANIAADETMSARITELSTP